MIKADTDPTCRLMDASHFSAKAYLEVKIRIVSQCMSFSAGTTKPLVVASRVPVAPPEQKHMFKLSIAPCFAFTYDDVPSLHSIV